MNIHITAFEENDREELRRIYKEVRASTFTWLNQQVIDLASFDQDTAGEFIWVAKINAEIVGFISVWLEDSFIHHLYIKDSFQHKGIGTKLLNHIRETIKAEMTLKCLEKNKAALNFYLKNGWKPRAKGISDEGTFLLLYRDLSN